MSKSTDALRHLFQRRVFLVVNVIVLGFLLLSFGRQWVRNASIENEIAKLSEKKNSLEARNNELLSLGQTIQTQYYLEKEGRLKYGLAKPGEQLIVVKGEEEMRQTSNSETVEAATSTEELAGEIVATHRTNNLQRWWAYFFNTEAYQEMKKDYAS